MTKKELKEKYPLQQIIGNILIYNDKDIEYFHGVPINFNIKTDIIKYDGGHGYEEAISGMTYLTATIGCFEKTENITLDDTTMKRIAKFNKETDIKKLDRQIEEKKKQIDKLDDILQDREGRIDKLKNFIKDIYKINLDEDDEDYWDD